MKVTAFNGSARKDGNTAILLNYALAELKKEGIETELVQFAGRELKGCAACYACVKNQDKRCVFKDDLLNSYIAKVEGSDGIILGSPTYFTDVPASMKAFIDRAGFVARANKDLFRRKVGAAVVAVRRAGAIHAFDTLNHFFLISQMIVPGSNYWNIGLGKQPGDVESDQEGIETMQILGKNMAWLLKRITVRG